MNISAGEKFALVGSSGGGKTTICNLIPRFYEIAGGSITLDGIDIRQIKKRSLRNQIGIVQQDVFLFAGTIRENIAYGKPGATDAEIEDAARRAEIHDDIMLMPNGYDSIVGERGIKLSGGQKQRVSIARCFLKNPPILILDEATSALDTATEMKIQHSFDELAKGRTIPSSLMNHAWNNTFFNGKWYLVDVTWDDPVSEYGETDRELYTYFLTGLTGKDNDHPAEAIDNDTDAPLF